jgi:isoquinoline 1-oxidoreductase beta subunit
MKIHRPTRREFLALTGITTSGLMLGACLPDGKANHGDGVRPNLFVAIDPDGTVTITAARSEMGQGARSSLPHIVADELDADWERVVVTQAVGDEKYGNQDTDGSRSIRNHYQQMREFGANARYLLLAAAAKQWSVPVGECSSDLHKIVHRASGRELGYGELAVAARDIKLPRGFEPTLKSPDQFRYIGKPMPIVDVADITTGRADYGIDVQLPGMLYAAVRRCPTVGGSVNSYNADAARALKGVVDVVEIPGPRGAVGFHPLGGVAVVANNTWTALKAADALEINWNSGPNTQDDSEQYLQQLQAASREPGLVARSQGDVDKALSAAGQVIEAEYLVPYLAHATLEPPAATAWYREGGCEVWAPTQNPQGARIELAKLLDLDDDDVAINVTLLGGGFGRKSKPDFILEAGWVSRAVKAPIKVCWSRPDDIRHDYYHAVSAQHLKAGLGEDKMPVAWLHRSVFPSIGTTFNLKSDNIGDLSHGCVDMPYAIDNIRIEGGEPAAPVRIGWLRSVCNIQHAFGINCFAHELAVAAERDPAEYLLDLIGPARRVDLGEDARYRNYGKPLQDFPIDTGRLRRVTETVMAAAGWGSTLPPGHALGIAAHRSFLSYVAMVVQVSTEGGKIKVERISSAVDIGQVINPDRVVAQMEGGIIFGLSLALYGEITTVNGAVQQSNFHDYPMLRIHESPAVDIHIVETDHAPTGVGEPPTPPVAPALCNAIYSATGQRIRRLPLAKHGLV